MFSEYNLQSEMPQLIPRPGTNGPSIVQGNVSGQLTASGNMPGLV